ncbi:MAG: serine hydrolase [Bacteroidia bacterium]|nr:serine hydrolase [Bacteroidia bacterium]MDW8347796.1 serine hydrolase [Bacteroidia bacterium]
MYIKKFFLFIFFLPYFIQGQALYFPPLSGGTWDTLSISSLGWCQDKMDSLIAFLGRENSKAFIVLKNGKIVVEKYYGTFTKDSLWYWASAGKTLTALTVGIAQKEGYLSIYDSTSKYLGIGWTSCSPAKERLITIKHQLSMTTGLDDNVPNPDCTLNTCLQYHSDAGTRWAYHNAPYTLLDQVIQSATGITLNAYITTRIKNKIGMDGFFYPIGYNNVYFSKARSMARFGLLLLNKGYWNTTPVLSDTAYFNEMTNSSQTLNLSYGYLTWLNGKPSFMVPGLPFVFAGKIIPNAPDNAYFALGKNGQIIAVYPSQKIVFVRMGNSGSSAAVELALTDSICKRLGQVMCASTYQHTTWVQKENDFKIYPNPVYSDESISISIPDLQNFTSLHLSICDLNGKVLWSGLFAGSDLMQGEIKCPALFSTGVYFVRIQSTHFSQTCKLIVM